MPDAISKANIGLTEYALAIADELQAEHGCKSRSELFEWLLLCQRHTAKDAAALFSRRRQRGQRGAIVVLPDDAVLPPEG